MPDAGNGAVAPGEERQRSPLEQAQRALGWLGLRHELVMRLFRLAPDWLDEAPLLTEALRVIEDLIGAEASSVIMLDRTAGDLYFAAATGPVAGALSEVRLARDEGIAGWCVSTGRVLRIGNVQADPHWHRQISDSLGFDVRQVLAAPIRVRTRVIGCLELVNKQGASGAEFLPEDEEVAAEAAECIGLLFTLRGRPPG